MTIKSTLATFLTLSIALLLTPSPAEAHLIGGTGLQNGLAHPILGLDHLLAIITVGILSTRIEQKALWALPVAFIFSMTIGGLLAIFGISLPFVQPAIALSIIMSGLAIATSKKISLPLAIIGVAIFALFHGHAHGEEIPAIASPILYATGFVLSTTLLHISGIILGYYARQTKLTQTLLKYAGMTISLTGIFLILN